MQRFIAVTAVASLTLLACEDKNNPTVQNAANQAKQAASDAWTTLKDKAVSTSTTAFNAAKKSVDDLVAKAATVPESAKPAVDSAVANAKAKLADADKALSDLKNATADTWKSLSEKVTTALAGVTDAVKSALDKIPK